MKWIFLQLILLFGIANSFGQNVGIGLTDPSRAKLEVNGAVGITSGIFGGDGHGISLMQNSAGIGFNQYYNGAFKYIGSGFAAVQWLHPNTGWLAFDMFPSGIANANAAGIDRVMTLTPQGHLGLGNASPNGYLQFPNNLSNRKIVFWEGANNDHQYIGLGLESGALRYAVDAPAARHAFYAGAGAGSSTFLMSIGGNRRVLIGQQEQGFKLGINTTEPLFTIEMVQAGDKGLGFINPLNGYRYWEAKSEAYETGVSDCLIFYYNGNTIFSSFISPIDGNYVSISDRRLKKDILPLQQTLPKLLQLKPASYHFKNDSSLQDCIGFIAQDVKQYFPELVIVKQSGDKDIPDVHSLNYNGFSVIAIKAIQEQQEMIDWLQKQVDELSKKLELIVQKN